MGIVSRFERRLQGAVGDVFARAFGGNVVPQEVEAALQQEAADNVRDLGGDHLLAPNSYVITINTSDHDQLLTDQDLTTRAFAKHLQDYIREQGWQTYGEVHVAFEASSTLHTGQFRTRGRVDPDAGRNAEPSPQRRPAHPQSGAGPMTQNTGYDPSREPAESDPHRRGYGPPPAGRGPQNGAYQDDYRAPESGGYPDYQGGYDPQHPQPGGPGYQQGGYQQQGFGGPQGGYPQQQGYGPQGYDQGFGGPGRGAPQGYDGYGQGTQDQGYGPGSQQGYGRPGGYPDQGFAPGPQGFNDPGAGGPEPGYGPPPGYGPGGGYQDHGFADQGGYPDDQGFGPGGPGPAGPPPGQPGGPPEQAYSQGGYGGGYSGYGPGAGTNFSATLQLDDGSGRTYQLRDGSNIIGRGQDAHFRLPDTGVSRRHIEVRWDGQTAMLSDLGSTNGTLVNGSPVQDWQLADGDVIRAGHSEILIRII